MKSKNGITLIVLVVTIIVMLILVGTSVSLIVNEKIVDKTGKTVQNVNKKSEKQRTEENRLFGEWNNEREVDRNITNQDQEDTQKPGGSEAGWEETDGEEFEEESL